MPPSLQDKRIYALDLSLVVAGTKYRGQFEERLKSIIAEASKDPSVVLFIDEIHSIIGTGAAEGSLDAANILKPALSRGEVQCIGATTHKEFAKDIDKDRSLVRRFQPVNVNPPDEAETLKILGGIQNRYELFHRVKYSPATLQAAVYLSNRYITDRFLPDKAIDLLDEAGARVKLRGGARRGREPQGRGGAAPGHQRDERGGAEPGLRARRAPAPEGSAAAGAAAGGHRGAVRRGLREVRPGAASRTSRTWWRPGPASRSRP